MIGSYAASDLCEQGVEVATFDSAQPRGILQDYADRMRTLVGDVGDRNQVRAAVEKSRARRIIHLAAVLGRACDDDPVSAMKINVDGTLNVLEAARDCGVERVVYASSGEVYGRGDRVRQEELALGPQFSIYAASKILGERLGARYAARGNFRFIALRFGLTFGAATIASPGEAMMIQRILESLDGTAVAVAEVSGSSRRQLTYARDAAAAAVLAALHPKPAFDLYNVSGPAENFMTLEAFQQIVRRQSANAGKVTFTGPEKQLGPMDTKRIRDDLQFVPRFGIAEGLRARAEDKRRWWS